jgi:hypothetical protein
MFQSPSAKGKKGKGSVKVGGASAKVHLPNDTEFEIRVQVSLVLFYLSSQLWCCLLILCPCGEMHEMWASWWVVDLLFGCGWARWPEDWVWVHWSLRRRLFDLKSCATTTTTIPSAAE